GQGDQAAGGRVQYFERGGAGGDHASYHGAGDRRDRARRTGGGEGLAHRENRRDWNGSNDRIGGLHTSDSESESARGDLYASLSAAGAAGRRRLDRQRHRRAHGNAL